MKYIILTIALVFSGCIQKESSQPSQHDEHNFELIQLGSMRRDQYLLDKKTGQIWAKTCMYSKPSPNSIDCEFTAWMKEDIQDMNGATADSIRTFARSLGH